MLHFCGLILLISKEMVLASLPKEIRYLKGYLEFILALPPEQVHEETDVSMLDDALHGIVEDYDEQWSILLKRDAELLKRWLQSTAPGNDNGYFLVPFLETFERGQKRAAAVLEEARRSKSGLSISSPLEGVAIADEYSRLSLTWGDGTSLELIPAEDEEHFSFERNNIEHHRDQNENEISEHRLGIWEATKLILQSSKPFFWKEVHYYLSSGGTFVMGSAARNGDKNFDTLMIDRAIEALQKSKGEQDVAPNA